jgi:Phycobilisome protein
MLSQFLQTLNATDNGYLTAKDQKAVLAYARSIPDRFAAVRDLQSLEPNIIQQALTTIGEADYVAVNLEAWGWTDAQTDLKLILRTIAQALLCEDHQLLERRVLVHLRRKLRYLDFPQDMTYDLFMKLISYTEVHLEPSSCTWITPYFGPLLTSMTPGHIPQESEV